MTLRQKRNGLRLTQPQKSALKGSKSTLLLSKLPALTIRLLRLVSLHFMSITTMIQLKP